MSASAGLILLSMSLSGQEVSLSGRVFAPNDQKPLEGAIIITSKGSQAISDENGSFTLPCSDSMTIVFTHPRFAGVRRTVVECGPEIVVTLAARNNYIEEVKVNAGNNRQQLSQPQSVVVLQRTEIRRQTGLFLDDAVNTNVPGVLMERRTISAGQQLNIRGYGNGARGTNGVSSNFDGQGYKVYLNGIPVTDAEGITVMDDIDFGSVSRVNVIKGPAGSLYGLAIAGAMHLYTEEAEPGKISVGQDVLAGSYGLERFTTRVSIGGSQSSMLVNYGKQKFGGFTPHTASEKDFVNVIGSARLNGRQAVSAYMGFSDSYDERNGELTIGQFDTMNYSGNPNYIKNNAHSHVVGTRAGLSHTYRFTDRVSNTTSVFGSGLSSDASSAGGWTDRHPVNFGARTSFVTLFRFGSLTLSGETGAEFQRQYAQTIGYAMVADSSDLSGYNIVGAMRSNQSTSARTGFYFTEWVLDLPGRISVTAGASISHMYLRLSDRLYNANNNRPGHFLPAGYAAGYKNMVSPRLAINKMFSSTMSVYASYSKGYRAPVTSYFFIPVTGEVNRGLKPEVGEQVEAGVKGNLVNERIHFQMAVFRASFFNKMTAVAVPLNSVTTGYSYLVNGGSQDNTGIEFLLKADAFSRDHGVLRLFSPFANFCYSYFRYGHFRFQTLNSTRTSVNETDYSNLVVAGVPPVTANAGIDFHLAGGVYGNVTYSYRDAMYFTSDNKNKAKEFSLLNAKAGIRHTWADHFETDLFAGANNLTGSRYYYMLFINQLPDAYIPAPPEVNFFAGVNLRYIW